MPRTRKTAAAAPAAPATPAAPAAGRRRRRGAATATTEAPAPAATTEENGSGTQKGNAEALAKAREAKREEREAQEKTQLEQLLKRFGEHPAVPDGVEGEESLSVVAKDLNITSGKAAFILMKDAVAKGKVPAITGKDDDEMVKAIHAARNEAGTYSSWGWLAARSSWPESRIKGELEDAGLYTPKAENIASVRAEQSKPEPAAEPAAAETTEGAKPAGRRRRRGNA
jgi:hypothetical protein